MTIFQQEFLGKKTIKMRVFVTHFCFLIIVFDDGNKVDNYNKKQNQYIYRSKKKSLKGFNAQRVLSKDVAPI